MKDKKNLRNTFYNYSFKINNVIKIFRFVIKTGNTYNSFPK